MITGVQQLTENEKNEVSSILKKGPAIDIIVGNAVDINTYESYAIDLYNNVGYSGDDYVGTIVVIDGKMLFLSCEDLIELE